MENNARISTSLSSSPVSSTLSSPASSPEQVLLQIASLNDRELLERIGRLVERERSATASLVAHLAEMDRRRLHSGLGYSSLFNYCTEALHLSEHASYKRIEAARAARRFPVLLARLAEGALHLSAVVLLAPVLTEGNHQALIEDARHQTKRQVEAIVARVRPAGPMPSIVRRVPAPQAPVQPAAILPGQPAAVRTAVPREAPPAASTPPPRPIVAPLAPASYKVQFTAGAEMHDRLLRAQALLRHKVPNGDIAQILDLALIALLEKTEARKFGRRKVKSTAERRPVARPVDPKESRAQTRSRHIPAEVRRAVWERDQGRCTFTSADGVRCTETGFLEFDHREPYACGGPATVANIRLACKQHNLHLSRLRFGPDRWRVREESPSYGGFGVPGSGKNITTRPGASSGVRCGRSAPPTGRWELAGTTLGQMTAPIERDLRAWPNPGTGGCYFLPPHPSRVGKPGQRTTTVLTLAPPAGTDSRAK